jgi:uncharacterized membrane protein YGL010W
MMDQSEILSSSQIIIIITLFSAGAQMLRRLLLPATENSAIMLSQNHLVKLWVKGFYHNLTISQPTLR